MSTSYTISQLNGLSTIKVNAAVFEQNAISNNADLISYINANTTINASRTCTSIDINASPIEIIFDGALSNPSQIDALVYCLGTYVYVENSVTYDKIINITPTISKTNSTTYIRLASFTYEGSNKIGNIKKILLSGYMDNSITNYKIKVNDKTNNNIIVENTFTNTDEEIIDLTPLVSIPNSRAVIEILAKKTGGSTSKNIYINSITLYF